MAFSAWRYSRKRYLVSVTCNSDLVLVLMCCLSHHHSEYARGTWKYLEELWKSPSGGKLGVSLLPCIQTSDTVMAVPSVGDFVYGFQTLTPEELGKFNKPEWKVGYRFVTFICEASRLLPYFLEKFKSRNGVVVSKHLESLEQIADKFDIIINCAGLGAHQLNNDKSMYPIRGHIFRVNIHHYFVYGDVKCNF